MNKCQFKHCSYPHYRAFASKIHFNDQKGRLIGKTQLPENVNYLSLSAFNVSSKLQWHAGSLLFFTGRLMINLFRVGKLLQYFKNICLTTPTFLRLVNCDVTLSFENSTHLIYLQSKVTKVKVQNFIIKIW